MPKTYTIPAAVLRKLIDAADYGADVREHDGTQARKDGEHEAARNAARDVKAWRAGIVRALDIERTA